MMNPDPPFSVRVRWLGRTRFAQLLSKIQNICYMLSHSPETPRMRVDAPTGEMDWVEAAGDIAQGPERTPGIFLLQTLVTH
jgi:hypothetical protein